MTTMPTRLDHPPRTPRKEFELRAMKHFNSTRQFWAHYVDAGELGLLRLSNTGQNWVAEWLEIETLPAHSSPQAVDGKRAALKP